MAAVTGRSAKIRYTSATFSTSTGEAFTSLTATTDRVLFRITDGTKRQWTRDQPPVVYVNTTAHTDFAINYVQGKLTFGTALTTAESAQVTGDVYHVTASYLPGTRGWTLDIDTDMLDVSTLSTSTADKVWRTFIPGLSGATVDLDRIVEQPTTATPLWFDHMNTNQDVILELITESTNKFEGYARVNADGYATAVDALTAESVTLTVDGPLYYATTE